MKTICIGTFICVVLMMGCSKTQTPATPPSSSVNDNLSKHSIEELRTVLTERHLRSTYSSHVTPEDLKGVTDKQLTDTLRYRQKAIYGEEDRRHDYYDILDNSDYSRVANSVAALVKPNRYHLDGGTAKLVAPQLGSAYHLCSGQSFETQPTAAYCTGFVVGDDLIATAGHCIGDDWKSIRIIFSYRMVKDHDGIHLDTVTSDDVYQPIAVIAKQQPPGDLDYALLRLDRKIKGHPPLPLHSTGQVTEHEGVYTMGYPAGLPLKLADSASVRSVKPVYFVSNLDTFGGNSGSPVLNASTHMVEGILVRGERDWVSNGSCQVALVCPTTGCSGEDATLIGEIKDYVAAPQTTDLMELRAEQPAPFTREFTSGPKLSGSGKGFSEEYVLTSDPPPDGYRILRYDYSLTGDRRCNSWSTCKVGIEGNKVVMRFSLQGHDERPSPGQAASEGHLTVTYGPSKK